jgi:hypothetical protein
MASRRLTPTRVSWSIRKNSSESGPGTVPTTLASAESKPSPASTLITSRSSTSGSAFCISVRRSSILRRTQASGPKKPSKRGAPRRNRRCIKLPATDWAKKANTMPIIVVKTLITMNELASRLAGDPASSSLCWIFCM